MRIVYTLLFAALSFSASSQVFINEILAGNQNDIQDDFFEYDDWIEIYNAGGILNLAGYYLSDDPDSLDKFLIPSTNPGLTTVLPGSHAIFWIDNDPQQGENHATFKLSTDGETVFLVEPDGETIVDSITYPQQQPDISYGRECDGCANWIFFDVTTPDDQNSFVQLPAQTLYINEVLVNNVNNVDDELGEHEAWIEIFNPNPVQVNMANYKIQIDGGATYTIANNDPVRTTVDEDGFMIFWADGETNQGANHLLQTLSNPTGTITLIGPYNEAVAEYTYEETGADISWGLTVDGGVNSGSFVIPTPRASNQLIILEPEELYINEIMAENDSDTLDTALEYEDWIEIFNPNDYEVDLAGYFISDNPDNPMKWQVPTDHPDSSIIPAGGYLLFFADEQSSEGWNHMNFRLSNNGESVILRSPDGFSIADEIDFGQQYGDTSFGRFTDGSPQWVLFTETTPEYSNNGATVQVEEFSSVAEVYPNPVMRGQDVRFSDVVNVDVYSMSGSLVQQVTNTRTVNTSNLVQGIYLLIINDHQHAKLLVN